MGVSGALARLAVRHSHLLVIEVPGHWLTRVAVERLAGIRGWRLAVSPADADILAVCGSPGPELALAAVSLWEQLPGPRARIDVAAPDLVAAALDQADAVLRDTARQRRDSTARDGQGSHDGEDPAASGRDDPAAARHERPATAYGGHPTDWRGACSAVRGDAMGPAAIESAPRGAIALAHGGEDRDGLEMDVLHVRLGPVLPDWPAGLVLRAHLHGDLIVEAQAGVVDAGQGGYASGAHVVGGDTSGEASQDVGEFAAQRCDNAARVLALAGWQDAAGRARAVRDRFLTGEWSVATTELARLRRRVRRSGLLRWSLRRVGPLLPGELARLGLAPELTGDVWDRLNGMLDRAVAAVGGSGSVVVSLPVTPPAAVAGVVSGWDVATARLIVASLDIAALGTVRDG
ncbi:hypothetical protein [Salinispora tropica]|uniref:Uncharacterized protein n=1 Tax=Salinispora tropica (strain ATCC BAA-916 / DSM 44818 / JCM 13857 / NBRC 105044 / CNB-440) TaxID=369723 RepID=A4X2Z4_SALTO|nr:hypothetical protein [Salinispora tropica]ABP53244.1 hypothetical protein Strop_0767 [Salinispora tropica CNB-440]